MIKQILKNLDQLPLLPQNIQKLIGIVNTANADPADLIRIVQQDPSLAMQALHLCNSAYYSLPIEITSVTQAVRYLGTDTVCGLALAAYFQGLVPSKGPVQDSPWLTGLKDHLLTTAYLSEMIAKTIGKMKMSATLFTAGLLHDVGKLVFSKLGSQAARDVFRFAEENATAIIEAEQEVLGTNHAIVGHQLAIRWQLPEILMEVIRFHHDPFGGQYHQTFYVYLANQIAACHKDENRLEACLSTPNVVSVCREIGVAAGQITPWIKKWNDDLLRREFGSDTL